MNRGGGRGLRSSPCGCAGFEGHCPPQKSETRVGRVVMVLFTACGIVCVCQIGWLAHMFHGPAHALWFISASQYCDYSHANTALTKRKLFVCYVHVFV